MFAEQGIFLGNPSALLFAGRACLLRFFYEHIGNVFLYRINQAAFGIGAGYLIPLKPYIGLAQGTSHYV